MLCHPFGTSSASDARHLVLCDGACSHEPGQLGRSQQRSSDQQLCGTGTATRLTATTLLMILNWICCKHHMQDAAEEMEQQEQQQLQEEQVPAPVSLLEALNDDALDRVLICFMRASGGEQAALAAHRHWRLVCKRMAASAGHPSIWQQLVYETFHAHLVVAGPDASRSAALQAARVHRSALLQFPLPPIEPGQPRQAVQNDYHLLFRVLAQITPQPTVGPAAAPAAAARAAAAPAAPPQQPAWQQPLLMLPAPLPAVGQAPVPAAAQPAEQPQRQRWGEHARVAAEDCPPVARRQYYECCLAIALNAVDAGDARGWLGALQLLRAQEEQERRRQQGEAISAAAMAARARTSTSAGPTLMLGPLTPEARLQLHQRAAALEPDMPLVANPPAPHALRRGVDLVSEQAWYYTLLRDPTHFTDDERFGVLLEGVEARAGGLEERIAAAAPFLEGLMVEKGFRCPGHDVATAWLRACDEMERACALLVQLLDEPVRGEGGRWREMRSRRHAAAGRVQRIATELDAMRDAVRALLPLQWCMLKLTGMLAVGRAAAAAQEGELLAAIKVDVAVKMAVETAGAAEAAALVPATAAPAAAGVTNSADGVEAPCAAPMAPAAWLAETGTAGVVVAGPSARAAPILANIGAECEVVRTLWLEMPPCGSLREDCLTAVDRLEALCGWQVPSNC